MIRILGVDPGTLNCGYAVVQYVLPQPGQPSQAPREVLAMGAVVAPPTTPMGERYKDIYNTLSEMATKHHIQCIACESFTGRSSMSMDAVKGLIGIITMLSHTMELPFLKFSPTTVKRTATGNGRAGKEAVEAAMCSAFKVAPGQTPVDMYDAIAIANAVIVTTEEKVEETRDLARWIVQNNGVISLKNVMQSGLAKHRRHAAALIDTVVCIYNGKKQGHKVLFDLPLTPTVSTPP